MNAPWQTPLLDLADPTKLPNLAANTGEVNFAQDLSAAANEPDFVGAWHRIMVAISSSGKFKGAADLADQCLAESQGWKNVSGNIRIFEGTCAVIKQLLSAGKQLSNEKKAAWQKCQTHLAAWRGAYSSSPQETVAAMTVDSVLYDKHGPMSVDEAFSAIPKSGDISPELVRDVVRWYLVDFRLAYRNDIKIKLAQVECERCHRKHDEGAECPHCQLAEKNIAEAKRALDARRWDSAESKAKEALEIWPGNETATDLLNQAGKGADEARKAAAQEVQNANSAIESLLDSGNYRDARAKVGETEKRKLPGFDANGWRKKIQAAENAARQEREAAALRERQEKIRKLEEAFDSACTVAEWDKAKRIGRDLARAGAETDEHWNAEVEKRRRSHRKDLEKSFEESIAAFDQALARKDVKQAETAFEKAKETDDAFRKAFGGNQFANKIQKAEQRFANARQALLVEGLRKVESVTATGSTQGKPQIVVSWKPGSGGTPVAKWRIRRRRKENPATDVFETAGSATSYRDETAKLGVEYEYGLTPIAELATSAGKKEFKAKEGADAEAWSGFAVCLAPLPKGSFSGSGQGMEGVGGVVSLRWKTPDGISPGVPYRFLLSRADGKFRDQNVTASGGMYEDGGVDVGSTLEYTLRFELCGRDMGDETIRVGVRKVQPPPPVGKFSFRRSAQGALIVAWEWPDDLDACLWGVSDDEVTTPDGIAKTARRRISKARYDENGGVVPTIPPGGAPAWLTVFGIRTFGDREFYSKGRSVPIRETVLEYGVETHPGGLFSKRKPAALVMRSSTGYYPEMEIRADANRTAVLSRRGGRLVLHLDPENSGPEKRIALDGVAAPGEFVRVYLARADAENCRLNHPSGFEVR